MLFHHCLMPLLENFQHNFSSPREQFNQTRYSMIKIVSGRLVGMVIQSGIHRSYCHWHNDIVPAIRVSIPFRSLVIVFLIHVVMFPLEIILKFGNEIKITELPFNKRWQYAETICIYTKLYWFVFESQNILLSKNNLPTISCVVLQAVIQKLRRSYLVVLSVLSEWGVFLTQLLLIKW